MGDSICALGHGLQEILGSKVPWNGARLLAAQASDGMHALGSVLAAPAELALCLCHGSVHGSCAPGMPWKGQTKANPCPSSQQGGMKWTQRTPSFSPVLPWIIWWPRRSWARRQEKDFTNTSDASRVYGEYPSQPWDKDERTLGGACKACCSLLSGPSFASLSEVIIWLVAVIRFLHWDLILCFCLFASVCFSVP